MGARQGPITMKRVAEIQPCRQPGFPTQEDSNYHFHDKQRALNILSAHRTVEFRRHEGTVIYEDVLSWVLLCLFMVSASSSLRLERGFRDLEEAFEALGMFHNGDLVSWAANYLLARHLYDYDSGKALHHDNMLAAGIDPWYDIPLEIERLRKEFRDDWLLFHDVR